ncbi:MAG: uracil-DNA glycosylase [Capsulimonadaceae bacterium]
MDNTDVAADKISAVAALEDAARTCTACGLSAARTNVVFGTGNVNSPLMLVGEGPGMNEDATGLPFVGPAGHLLDECLREAGMLRKHVYITNVIKCRACGMEGGRVQNRPPASEELGACVPRWLEKQISVIRPLVIVCIGGPAAATLIRPGFSVMREHGKWFEGKYCRYTTAVLHPAFILRQEGSEYQAGRQSLVDDLTAARDKAKAAKTEPKLSLF